MHCNELHHVYGETNSNTFLRNAETANVSCNADHLINTHAMLNPNARDFISGTNISQCCTYVNSDKYLLTLNPKAKIFVPSRVISNNEHMDKLPPCQPHVYVFETSLSQPHGGSHCSPIFKLNPYAEPFVSSKNVLNPCTMVFAPTYISLSDIETDTEVSMISPNNENIPSIEESNESSPYAILKDIRVKNTNRIIFAHLNINSIRNKFEMISDLVNGRIDILLISETKIDATFPTSQFEIPGFSSPFRLDRTERGGGLLLYIRGGYPC